MINALWTPVSNALEAVSGGGADCAICGGWAIDLFLNRITRHHADVDIAIKREDQLRFQSHMLSNGWHLQIAHQGTLTPWPANAFLELPLHTIWCTRENEFLELLINEWDANTFRFRRDQSITMPAENASIKTASGFRLLAPEIVLLYKSKHPQQN